MITSNDYLSRQIYSIKLEYGQKINERIMDFINMGKSDNYSLFIELSFCILTANTSAEMGIKTQRLINTGFIEYDLDKLKDELKKNRYRFYNKRAEYIVDSRFIIPEIKNLLLNKDHEYIRDYLVKNIKGIGYKEASHFLRNVGIFDFAILDKHIMRLMDENNYIDDVKLSTGSDYIKNELIFKKIARKFHMKPGVMDIYLWKIATGKILK